MIWFVNSSWYHNGKKVEMGGWYNAAVSWVFFSFKQGNEFSSFAHMMEMMMIIILYNIQFTLDFYEVCVRLWIWNRKKYTILSSVRQVFPLPFLLPEVVQVYWKNTSVKKCIPISRIVQPHSKNFNFPLQSTEKQMTAYLVLVFLIEIWSNIRQSVGMLKDKKYYCVKTFVMHVTFAKNKSFCCFVWHQDKCTGWWGQE